MDLRSGTLRFGGRGAQPADEILDLRPYLGVNNIGSIMKRSSYVFELRLLEVELGEVWVGTGARAEPRKRGRTEIEWLLRVRAPQCARGAVAARGAASCGG